MKKILYTSAFVLFTFGIVNLSSCKKSIQEDEETKDLVTLAENSQLDESVTDNFTEIMGSSMLDLNLFETPTQSVNSQSYNQEFAANADSSCRVVTITPTGNVFPKTMTIDFGSGCGAAGNVRKGKIVSVISGPMRKSGTVIETSFVDFYVNNNKITGSKRIVINGLNENLNLNFTVSINQTVTSVTGATRTYNSVYLIEWRQGILTPSKADDIYAIRGTESGRDSQGRNFSSTTLSPLIKKMNCAFIVAGKNQTNVTGRPQFILDYGDGQCDNKATVTANGQTKEIVLKK
jgi:hypothetical protein